MKAIQIKGAIVRNSDKEIYDWFGIEATAPKDVELGLADANGLDVDVVINSGGGDVYSGSEIFTLLKAYKGTVRVQIVGIAASAASVIAMAGDNIAMSPTSQLMIHNVWSYAEGDYRDFEKEAEILKSHNESIANAYMIKTGKDKEELLAIMDKETYFNAREAKEAGLIDEIMFDEEKKIAASIKNGMIPQEIVDKMRNYLNKEKEVSKTTDLQKSDEIDVSKARLNLLKLLEVKT